MAGKMVLRQVGSALVREPASPPGCTDAEENGL